MNDGLDAAIAERGTIYDLMWQREGKRFELAIEAVLPEENYPEIGDLALSREGYAVRYEVAIGLDETERAVILDEQILLTQSYPAWNDTANWQDGSVFLRPDGSDWSQVIHSTGGGKEYRITPEMPDTEMNGRDFMLSFRRDEQRPVFQRMYRKAFPTGEWLEGLLRTRVLRVDLQPELLRQASRPGQGKSFAKGGANLPWMVDDLEKSNREAFAQWRAHVRTALHDLKSIQTIEREDDHHRYLMVEYANGLKVPAWALSEGTLCFLALTFLAYQSKPGDMYLIEEPETHIHPLNIEPVLQSLSSVYGGQVLISTHSPQVLAMTEVENVLIFERDTEKGTQILGGKDHPRLREWKGEVSLGTLFAGGVLG
ncbi:MAG: ATP-binding protein [Tepidisphaeraceae bacterium]